MRIRKRFPPPSQPLLDPKHNNPVLVQQLKHEETAKLESLPSDLPNPPLPQPSDQLGNKPTRWVFFGGNSDQQKMEEKDVEEAEKEKHSIGNDNKKENLLTPQLLGSNLLPRQLSSSSDLDEGRQCEGDNVIPLKKRRDERYVNTSMNILSEATMKSKTNKKYPDGGDSSNDKVGVDEKKSKRGSVILEGSRCSRVNGRGWRCCQQTLVGYSLCEHHLGKGKTSTKNKEKTCTLDNEKMKKKKMKKLGIVKARSLSSLLCQTTDTSVAALVNSTK